MQGNGISKFFYLNPKKAIKIMSRYTSGCPPQRIHRGESYIRFMGVNSKSALFWSQSNG